MTVIRQQANRILNAYEEGMVQGAITAIEYFCPNISKADMANKLRQIYSDKDSIEYWIDYYALEQ